MLPLVRVGAAVSADVVTSTKVFVMRYNITSLASARLLAREDLTRLPPRESTLDDRWTRKPSGPRYDTYVKMFQ